MQSNFNVDLWHAQTKNFNERETEYSNATEIDCIIVKLRNGIVSCFEGGDDQRVLVWKVADAIQGRDKLTPVCMTSKHRSNVFTIDFSCDNSFIFSGGEL